MNKKILFISYLFPPIGGGGVVRTLKFVKFLPQFGWQPRILTIKNGFYPIQDKTLLSEIPKNVEISRVKYFEPAGWTQNRYWQSFFAFIIYPFFLIPDRQILWFWPAFKKAAEIIKKENIKVIFTSSAPNSDHLVGYFLKKYYSVKWVADFRDEWANNPLRKFPTPIHRWINKYWEKKVISLADRVISVSKPITDYLQLLRPKDKKFFTITNGFDGQDFEGPKPRASKKQFTIIFSGSVYNSKIITPFLQAVKELNLPNLKADFIGLKKRISHREAVRVLFEADVLLLVLDPVDRPAVLTGKLFEYLAARKPILALVPLNSGVAHLIKLLKVGEIASAQDKEKIKEKILKLYERWRNHRLDIPKINLEKYERKNLTAELAKIFDNLTLPKKIKLCLIGNLASPQNQDLVRYFKDKNYEIHFISTKPVKLKNVQTYYLGPTGRTLWYFWRSKMRINYLIKQINPDIIHGQDLVFAGIWAYLSGFHPIVVTTWGSDVMNYEQFIGPEKYLIKKTLENADLVTVSSKALNDKAIKIGMPSQKARLVHFGVDLDIFQKRKKTRTQIIFCPRAIAPIYNTDVLIKAFDRIAKINKKAILALLDNVADDTYALEVEKLIIKLGLVDKIQFWPKVPNHQMADYYNLSEVVATLTSSDGCSVSFLEAMATESKIVATNLPYLKEWYKDKNLWLAPIRDAEATAKAILTALKFPSVKWQKIGQENRRLIAQKAESKDNFEKLNQLYRELI